MTTQKKKMKSLLTLQIMESKLAWPWINITESWNPGPTPAVKEKILASG